MEVVDPNIHIATLGEEVRDPAHTIPRAIPIALGVTLVVYATIAVAALCAVGPATLASSSAPLTAKAKVPANASQSTTDLSLIHI